MAANEKNKKKYTRTKIGYNVTETLDDGSRKVTRYAEKADKSILLSETLYKGDREIRTKYDGTSKTETTYQYDENDNPFLIRETKYKKRQKSKQY